MTAPRAPRALPGVRALRSAPAPPRRLRVVRRRRKPGDDPQPNANNYRWRRAGPLLRTFATTPLLRQPDARRSTPRIHRGEARAPFQRAPSRDSERRQAPGRTPSRPPTWTGWAGRKGWRARPAARSLVPWRAWPLTGRGPSVWLRDHATRAGNVPIRTRHLEP